MTATITLVLVSAVSASEPRYGSILNYGIASNTVTVGVDPHVIQGDRTGWVLGQICEGLLNYDKALNPVPWLAKSWHISDAGKTYTFALQPGIKFHNGQRDDSR